MTALELKQRNKPMKPAEYQRAMDHFIGPISTGVQVPDHTLMADLIGCTFGTSMRYSRGDRGVPLGTALLLRGWIAAGLTYPEAMALPLMARPE